jgi:hypothetical protein
MVADYIAAVLADAPAAFWQLQDAADFPQDSSGHGKHMDSKAVQTSLTYRAVGTTFGPANSFAINQQSASLYRSTDTVLTATDNITVEVWIKGFTQGNAFLEVFFFGASTGVTDANTLGTAFWGLGTTNAGKPIIRVRTASSLQDSPAATASFGTGAWTHVVILRRSGTWEVWINGVQDTGIGTFTATPAAYGGAGQIVYLGQAYPSAALSFQSAFAALYNSALSGTRIAAHYNAMLAFNNADYPELSFLGLGSSNVSRANGAGVSIFRS